MDIPLCYTLDNVEKETFRYKGKVYIRNPIGSWFFNYKNDPSMIPNEFDPSLVWDSEEQDWIHANTSPSPNNQEETFAASFSEEPDRKSDTDSDFAIESDIRLEIEIDKEKDQTKNSSIFLLPPLLSQKIQRTCECAFCGSLFAFSDWFKHFSSDHSPIQKLCSCQPKNQSNLLQHFYEEHARVIFHCACNKKFIKLADAIEHKENENCNA